MLKMVGKLLDLRRTDHRIGIGRGYRSGHCDRGIKNQIYKRTYEGDESVRIIVQTVSHVNSTGNKIQMSQSRMLWHIFEHGVEYFTAMFSLICIIITDFVGNTGRIKNMLWNTVQKVSEKAGAQANLYLKLMSSAYLRCSKPDIFTYHHFIRLASQSLERKMDFSFASADKPLCRQSSQPIKCHKALHN